MSQDIVKQIRKATRRQFTADEKIRIVSKVFEERSPYPIFAAARASHPLNTTAGPKHFWRPAGTG